jgi:predicted Abi (CAAX) family protease
VREQLLVLEDEPDVAAVRWQRGDVVIVEQHRAGIGGQQPCDHAQQRALAHTRRAEQRDHFAGGHLQRHPVEHRAIAEAHHQITNCEHRGLLAARQRR